MLEVKKDRILLLHLSPTPRVHHAELIESTELIEIPTPGSLEDTAGGGFPTGLQDVDEADRLPVIQQEMREWVSGHS